MTMRGPGAEVPQTQEAEHARIRRAVEGIGLPPGTSVRITIPGPAVDKMSVTIGTRPKSLGKVSER